MSEVLAQFKFENRFQITGRGLVIVGKVTNINFQSGHHLRYVEDYIEKTAKIWGIDWPRGEEIPAGIYLEEAGQTYFKTEGLNYLIGKVFDIVE